MKENDRPVALLPAGETNYDVYDPLENATTRISPKNTSRLSATAYSFYQPFPAAKLTGKDILKFALNVSKRELIMIALMGVAGGLLGMVFPVATGIVFDNIIPGAERNQLLQITSLLVATTIAACLFTLVRSFAVLRVEARVDSSLQAAMWDRVLRLPARFFRDYSSGDLAVRSLAMSQIRQILTNSTLSSMLSGIFSFFSLVLMFYYSWMLALIASVLAGIVLLISAASAYVQLGYARQLARVRGSIASMLLQFVNGITKLRVSGTENRAFAAWAFAFTHQKQLYMKIRQQANRLTIFNSVFPVLALAVVFWTASFFLNGGSLRKISTGAFLAFLAAFVQFLAALLQLTNSMVSILGIVPIYERAAPILQTMPEVDEGKAHPGELQGAIEVNHISFRYGPGSPLVLRDISLNLGARAFIAFTGPSGSGKSTLLRLLLGFEEPESGTISYDGQDIAGVDIQAVRQQIGVVLQSGRLISGSVFDNIVGSLPLTHDDAWEAARMAGLDKDIKAMPMGMHTFVSEGGGGFSGGQRQRLMIARAIVNKPRVLFFDEATSALDNQTQAIVSRSLESLRATRVVIAHRLSTIINADEIYVFDKGSIVQRGTYAELLNQPGLFQELVQRQVV
jgi:ATP-binding cassette subfamily C protein